MNVAVIGATTLIGRTIIQLLEDRNFPVEKLIPVESENQNNQVIDFKGQAYECISIEASLDIQPDIVFFTGDPEISVQWAENFANLKCYVIDNSPVWRMNENIKMIIPEINGDELVPEDYIIAGPNCTSIQMIMALQPLHDYFKIKRVVVSTYQTISGAGQKGIYQYDKEQRFGLADKAFAHEIYNNCLPHVDEFNVNGYTQDELRLMHEIKKILNEPGIQVSATCVRVPVKVGHSESINIEFENDFVLSKIKQLLEEAKGVKVLDDPMENIYPMPSLVQNSDEVLIGRIRRDYSNPNSLNMFVCANNLRRGAATNSLLIAEYISENFKK